MAGVEMTTPKTPQWRIEPEQVWLKCQGIRDLGRKEEFVVQFAANGEEYISFVPKRFVREDGYLLQALVIADVDGGLLVDIPAETLTSGPRILVPDAEKESVLTFSNWESLNGS